MKPSANKARTTAAGISVAFLAIVLGLHPTLAQQSPAEHGAHSPDKAAGTAHHVGPPPHPRADMRGPSTPGQDAFGAIQEIVAILKADPATDWSKVDLEGLRQHLIDMNHVTLQSETTVKRIDGGLQIAVTGKGRTLAGIRRMVPAHAREIDGMNGWRVHTETLPDGVSLTVTSDDLEEVRRIRGLGFIGLLVSGAHHQPHHLAMARGEFRHALP